MTLLPRSLFGRLVAILLLGLLLAQFLVVILMLQDRGQTLQEVSGMQLVHRIGAFIRLLERLPVSERSSIIDSMDAPGFNIELSDRPPPDEPDTVRARRIERLLQSELPGHQQIIALRHAPDPAIAAPPDQERFRHRPGMGMGRSMHSPRFPFAGFRIGIRLDDGTWVNISRPLSSDEVARPYRLLVYLSLLLVSILLLSLVAVRLVTRPLAQLARAADGLGRDINQPPLPESGPSEVRRAAAAFNTMQQRLQRYIEDRSGVLAAVSHDLKTPITRLRLRSEMLEDETLQARFGNDLDEMEQMVSSTLDYLRGTESREQPVLVDIGALLELIQDEMAELGWAVDIEPHGTQPLTGRPLALKRCLGNLIENAVRYGGRARIRLQEQGGNLLVIIADEGPGVPAETLENLFKPFHRGESSRNRESGGTGLGLSIARDIARAHGGDVILRPGAKGGLEAVVTLPRRQAD